MKTEFVMKLLASYAITVLGVTIVPYMLDAVFSFRVMRVSEVILVQIFIATVFIRFSVLGTQFINFKTFIAKYVLDYFVVSAIVYGFGWFWGWYTRESFLLFFIVITLIFITGAVLDLGHINKDVEFINKQIEIRRRRKKNENKKRAD